VSESAQAESRQFETEVRQLLKLMIHSLYSNKEIFLRELVSNASDALDKLRFEALSDPDLLKEGADLAITVEIDKEQRRIRIADNGIGMTRADVIANLGTIARSGTAEFLGQMTGDARKDAQLIGQFGVGFYSAFIVAERVTVESRRAGAAADEGVRWTSAGDGEYSVEDITRNERGTTVILELKDDEAEFAEVLRVETLIRKYSDHIAFPVTLLDPEAEEPRELNSATALWTRPRNDIDDDEYKEFYKHLAHDFADPLTWSHNRVEGKREYTSLLYIPANAPYDLWNREAPRGLKLYVQRVFIMDDAEQFLPLYLRFVKGIVDSSDLPLNVSRELLQQDAELTAMRGALTRRVLDMLKKLAGENDRYQAFWAQFGNVLKEGLIEDTANRDKLIRLLRFASTHSESQAQDRSLDEYLARADEKAGQKQEKIYYLVADNHATALASPHLEALKSADIEVLLLTDRIDPWLADALTDYDDRSFVDVTRADLELPAGSEDSEAPAEEEHKPLLDKVQKALEDRVESVGVSRRLVESPACVVTGNDALSPQLKHMLEASGQSLPESKPVLELNVGHPLVQRLDAESDDERFASLAGIVLDHALLAEGSSLDNPAEYVSRMNRLILELGEEISNSA